MCCLDDRFWSNRIPRNLPVVLRGIGVLRNMIGFAAAVTPVLRECSLYINSNDFLSFILILRFPQKAIIWSMAFWRFG